MFCFTIRKLKDSLNTRVIPAKTIDAIIRRQKAREETLRTSRSLMKMDDVPNSIPAMKASVKAVLLLLLDKLNVMFNLTQVSQIMKV